jgi:hypothetical protein
VDAVARRKNPISWRESNHGDSPDRSLVTIMTELPQLHCQSTTNVIATLRGVKTGLGRMANKTEVSREGATKCDGEGADWIQLTHDWAE